MRLKLLCYDAPEDIDSMAESGKTPDEIYAQDARQFKDQLKQ